MKEGTRVFWQGLLDTLGISCSIFGAGGVFILVFMEVWKFSPLLATSVSIFMLGLGAFEIADRIIGGEK